MNKFILFATLCIAGAALGIAEESFSLKRSPYENESSFLMQNNKVYSHETTTDKPQFVVNRTQRRHFQKDNANLCKLNIRASFDSDTYIPETGVLVNQNHTEEIWLDENKSATCSVPTGEYSLIYCFSKKDSEGVIVGTVLWLDDNITITDNTIITLNPEDASKRIKFTPLKKDGEKILLSRQRTVVNPENNQSKTDTLIYGNTDFCAYTLSLSHPILGQVLSTTRKAATETEYLIGDRPLFSVYLPMDIWITPHTKEWTVSLNTFYGANKDLYFATLQSNNEDSEIISNDIENYTDIPFPSIKQSLFGKNQDPLPARIPRPLVLIEDQNGSLPVPSTVDLEEFIDKFGANYHTIRLYPTNSISTQCLINSSVNFECIDALSSVSDTIWMDEEHFEIGTYYRKTYTTTPRLFLKNNNIRTIHNLEEAYFHNSKNAVVDEYNQCWHPWVPAFEETFNLIYGSTPHYITSFISGTHNSWEEGLGLHLSPLDYYGGYNSTLLVNSNWEIEYNGVNLNIDRKSFSCPFEWAWMRDTENVEPGEYKLTFSIPEDRVDNLPSNTTFTAYIDQQKDDCTAPAIQLLNFINTEGKFTNEFKNPAEGILRLVGGDFDWNNEINLPHSKECKMVIEASPYHLDFWKSLTPQLSELEAPIYYAPAYEIALGSLTSESESGWYDLRISMTDESGNYMIQTISPAFKVESLSSSVERVDAMSDIQIEGRNIKVPENVRIFSINGIPVSGHDLQPGLYLVTLAGTTKKVIIK